MATYILIVLTAGALFFTALLAISKFTDWFKKEKEVPIQFGFLQNDKTVSKLNVSTGDAAKLITFRFYNSSKFTLTGVILDIRIKRPLGLSGTKTALQNIPNGTIHGPATGFYHMIWPTLEILGDAKFDFSIELNTQNISPGTYYILTKVFSTQKDYIYKESKLKIIMS